VTTYRADLEARYRAIRESREQIRAALNRLRPPEPQPDTAKIMDAACARAWADRLDVRPIIRRVLARRKGRQGAAALFAVSKPKRDHRSRKQKRRDARRKREADRHAVAVEKWSAQ